MPEGTPAGKGDSKDALIKKQHDEIEKLKKDLREATKPSALLSVAAKAVKRNVREFFKREEKMKRMGSEIQDLEKKLKAADEENAKKSAVLFAAEQFSEDMATGQDPKQSEEDIQKKLGLPQTAEEALERYFRPVDIMGLMDDPSVWDDKAKAAVGQSGSTSGQAAQAAQATKAFNTSATDAEGHKPTEDPKPDEPGRENHGRRPRLAITVLPPQGSTGAQEQENEGQQVQQSSTEAKPSDTADAAAAMDASGSQDAARAADATDPIKAEPMPIHNDAASGGPKPEKSNNSKGPQTQPKQELPQASRDRRKSSEKAAPAQKPSFDKQGQDGQDAKKQDPQHGKKPDAATGKGTNKKQAGKLSDKRSSKNILQPTAAGRAESSKAKTGQDGKADNAETGCAPSKNNAQDKPAQKPRDQRSSKTKDAAISGRPEKPEKSENVKKTGASGNPALSTDSQDAAANTARQAQDNSRGTSPMPASTPAGMPATFQEISGANEEDPYEEEILSAEDIFGDDGESLFGDFDDSVFDDDDVS